METYEAFLWFYNVALGYGVMHARHFHRQLLAIEEMIKGAAGRGGW